MSQHPEIIAAPLTIWLAPVGTAFPLPNAAPGAGWVLLGTNGARNLGTGGVKVSHRKDIASALPPAGQTASPVVMIESEDLRVSFELIDLTLEQYAFVMAGNALAFTPRLPGVPGTTEIGLSIGSRNLPEFALLARGPSAYVEGLIAQYQLARAVEVGSPQITYQRGQPSGLALEFKALPDPAATSEATRFGRLVAQDSTAVAALLAEDGRYLLTSSDLYLEI